MNKRIWILDGHKFFLTKFKIWFPINDRLTNLMIKAFIIILFYIYLYKEKTMDDIYIYTHTHIWRIISIMCTAMSNFSSVGRDGRTVIYLHYIIISTNRIWKINKSRDYFLKKIKELFFRLVFTFKGWNRASCVLDWTVPPWPASVCWDFGPITRGQPH